MDKNDARVLMELDQLYKRLNRSPQERLKLLEENLKTAGSRDDVYLERASIYNFLGGYEKAYELIRTRKFHPWEGGEGKVSGQYIFSLVEMAKENIGSGRYRDAINQLESAQVYPYNLGEGKLAGAQENDIFYWLGCAYDSLNDCEKSKQYFEKATTGSDEPAAAIFYNDQQPDKLFYQGLSLQKLGKAEEAGQLFSKLINYGNAHLNDQVQIDYFAVSLPNLLIFETTLISAT